MLMKMQVPENENAARESIFIHYVMLINDDCTSTKKGAQNN